MILVTSDLRRVVSHKLHCVKTHVRELAKRKGCLVTSLLNKAKLEEAGNTEAGREFQSLPELTTHRTFSIKYKETLVFLIGNFHVSTHSADRQPDEIDFAHVIHELRFGKKLNHPDIVGKFNPLHQHSKLDGNSLESHDYVMKVVPTIHEDAIAYQYTHAYRSYISFGHGGRVVPALWFKYDLTPITVKYLRKRQPFYSFITKTGAKVKICASEESLAPKGCIAHYNGRLTPVVHFYNKVNKYHHISAVWNS
ncbi:Endoplasmic reticulum-Golgi intermediate compartment protein 1 [Portunus trituberculatus]|uniref:Endoplasmic reticulum-Golgi intermediate compartment protein 1 n=1 Tax=Portunus trituberculatus TaxID=210409 RepID=A0A5B7DNR1_PORTR|nr:Endoplasmic reticulum-Golgi intermediate compartment protein 1 [Portunus trituberculatus]